MFRKISIRSHFIHRYLDIYFVKQLNFSSGLLRKEGWLFCLFWFISKHCIILSCKVWLELVVFVDIRSKTSYPQCGIVFQYIAVKCSNCKLTRTYFVNTTILCLLVISATGCVRANFKAVLGWVVMCGTRKGLRSVA